MPFECPVCQNPLQQQTYEGTNIYPCADNCGIFLGRGNLKIIKESRQQQIPPSAIPRFDDDRGTVKNCPKCKATMSKRNHGELSSVVIDYCAACQGVWLDPGELEQIQVYFEAANDFNNDANAPVAGAYTCPQCSSLQVKGEICISCGLVFAKHQVRAAEQASRENTDATRASELENLFANLCRVEIVQKYHLTEALLGFERKNQYRVTLLPADKGKGNWRIDEENVSGLSILGRNLFGLLYTFTMSVIDGSGNKVLRLYRKPRLYFHLLEAYDEKGVEFGLIKRAFSFFHRVINVNNDKGQRQLRIVGPIWSPWTFYVYQGRTRVAVICKRWTGVLKEAYTDADKFDIEFIEPTNSTNKRLSIAALMLIDSLYFEGKKSFFNHLISAPGIQILISITSLIWFVNWL